MRTRCSTCAEPPAARTRPIHDADRRDERVDWNIVVPPQPTPAITEMSIPIMRSDLITLNLRVARLADCIVERCVLLADGAEAGKADLPPRVRTTVADEAPGVSRRGGRDARGSSGATRGGRSTSSAATRRAPPTSSASTSRRSTSGWCPTTTSDVARASQMAWRAHSSRRRCPHRPQSSDGLVTGHVGYVVSVDTVSVTAGGGAAGGGRCRRTRGPSRLRHLHPLPCNRRSSRTQRCCCD